MIKFSQIAEAAMDSLMDPGQKRTYPFDPAEELAYLLAVLAGGEEADPKEVRQARREIRQWVDDHMNV